MICPVCGAEVGESKLLCPECGHEFRFIPDFEPEVENQISDTLSEISIDDEELEELTPEEIEAAYKAFHDKYTLRRKIIYTVIYLIVVVLAADLVIRDYVGSDNVKHTSVEINNAEIDLIETKAESEAKMMASAGATSVNTAVPAPARYTAPQRPAGPAGRTGRPWPAAPCTSGN